MFFSLSQGDNGQIPGSEKSWSPGDEVSEVDGQLNDDQAAHELCKTCTEKIDSAEPQRGTFLIVRISKKRIRLARSSSSKILQKYGLAHIF